MRYSHPEIHLVKPQEEEKGDLDEFITQVANSFVKIELIKYFYRNPNFLGTVQDLALAIGRDSKKISKGIGDLVAVGIIQKSGRKNAAIWSYKPDETLHRNVTLFIKAYEGPDLRQWIVNKVIRGGG